MDSRTDCRTGGLQAAVDSYSVRWGKRGHGWIRGLCRCPRQIQKCDRRGRWHACTGLNLDVRCTDTIEACELIVAFRALSVKPKRLG